MQKKILLEIKNMTKTFGPVTALKGVDLTLYEGDVLGLIGENGSGKSTITSIAAGMQKATSLDFMKYKGEDWSPKTMLDALENKGEGAHGIGMIVQESGTIGGISVAENIFLGDLAQFRVFKLKNGKTFGPISKKRLYAKAKEALEAIGITNVRPETPMYMLDFQTRKLVEIARTVMKDPDVLVIDETSTALAQDGRKILYNIINKYRGTEKAVIFISHDLDEIMEVCDTLTVLRDGNIIRTFERTEYDPDEIRKAMIGRELQGDYYRADFEPSRLDEVALKFDSVNLNEIKNVSFELHKGEILGIGGLAQCGMHTIGKAAFGVLKPQEGEVSVYGKKVTNEKMAMDNGIGYVSKDRDIESLVLPASIKDNISVAGMNVFSIKNFLILAGREKKYVDNEIDNLSIKCSSREQTVQTLSGGNKQKVVFGKWVGRGSEILILDCPTRGVDIGVKQAMYQLMMKLKQEGKAILLISEEMPELMGMSDRILIMKEGNITKEFMRSKDLTDAEIIGYMI